MIRAENRANQWEPGKLWSLWSFMERCGVGELVDLQSFFTAVGNMAGNVPEMHLNQDQATLIQEKARTYLPLLEKLDLYVSARAMRKILACFDAAEIVEGKTIFRGQNKDNITGALSSIANLVGEEMHTKLFLILPAGKAPYFEQAKPIFGKEVAGSFPEAAEDISEAGKCFGVGRYTATVFHLMRAMEIALHRLGGKLGATVQNKHGEPITWGVILGNIGRKIDDLPKGAEQREWREVHLLLTNVNQAWRTETMHPKQTYTEEEAKTILDSCAAFMRRLALLS